MMRSSFPQLACGRSAGDEDGFLLLLSAEKNEAIIDSL
jgi:hypothetical protein